MSSLPIVISPETPADVAVIRLVLVTAFPTGAEADLVDALRRADHLTLSLCARIENSVVGLAALSPVTIDDQPSGLGLGPVAVVPRFQHREVGSTLVRGALAWCREHRVGSVVVLGDPAYYRRFGFAPASQWNLRDQFNGGDAFKAIELLPYALAGPGGLVKYASEFALVA